ncbi:hypothetical protein TNCV_694621 [Trichonephila clavipes]|nr:hypothetical protein TNCV_694621 [Trichonephila clavipes]
MLCFGLKVLPLACAAVTQWSWSWSGRCVISSSPCVIEDHRIERLMYIKSINALNPLVGVMRWFEEGVPALLSSTLDQGSKLQCPSPIVFVLPYNATRQIGQIRESFVIWVEAIRPLEDVGKNGRNKARFQCHDGAGRSKTTSDRKDRFIVRSVVTATDSSLSTIRRATRPQVSTVTIHRRLIEQNLRRTNHYATCHSRLHTVEPDYSSAWVDQVGIKLTGDV